MSNALTAERHDLSWQWQTVLGRLQVDMNAGAFDAWLEGSRAARIEGDTLIVEPRSAFMCDWLNDHLAVVVERAVAAVIERELRVRFVPKGCGSNTEPAAVSIAARRPAVVPPVSLTSSGMIGSVNCNFTFDRYLPAIGNRLAHHSCMRLTEADANPISPIVVYGSPGMGKTHLLHAMARRAVSLGWTVACLSAEQFTNRYVDAMRGQRMGGFQAELRRVRLLVIDDLQYLAGRKGTLDELVHTIDEVAGGGGHVVMAGEVPPYEMDLPQRLASRLMAGIMVRIEPFLAEERRAYIEQLAREQRVGLPAWAIDRIAGCEVPSVRVLLGAVNAAIMLQQSGMLDLRQLDARLTHITATASSPASLDDRAMLELIAKHFQTTFEELVGRSRSGSVGEARAVAAAVLHGRGRSFAQVGAALGKRDASTVKGICRRGQEIIEEDGGLRARLAG